MADPALSGAEQSPSPTPQDSGKTGMITAIILVVIVVGGLMLFSRRQAPSPVDTESLVTEEDQGGIEDGLGDVSLEGDTIDDAPVGNSVDTTTDAAVKSFTVAGSNFKFDPAEIRVKQGDTVRITLTNNSPMPHDWNLDEFNATTPVIQTGQTATIEFVAARSGTFEYYCSVGNHREMGMVGKLVVE